MKNFILSTLALVAFGFGNPATANKNNSPDSKEKKIIVMVNTADWCPACKANGPRVEKNVISEFAKNPKCEIVVNDMTSDDTKATSKKECENAGITDVAFANMGTGVIYFINSETKEIISQISVTKSDEEIKKAFDEALAKV